MLPPCEPVLASIARCTPRRITAGIGAVNARWHLLAGCIAAVPVLAALWILPRDLPQDGRIALTVLALAVIGWTVTRLGDCLVGLAAALSLAVMGVLSTETLFGTLGNELIWLLVAAFIISAALRASGLIERLAFAVIRRAGTVRRLVIGLAGVIAATAFVIPSTSGRAALLLPVFLALAERIDSQRIVRALALLFPTIILLSAAGSLTGAGAHIVAVDFMARVANERIGYLSWMAACLPFALLSSGVAAAVILRLFLTEEEASRRLDLAPLRREPLAPRQLAIALVVLSMVGLWMAVPMHGFSLALIALIGALAVLLPGVAPLPPQDAFKAVDLELIVFLAATMALAEALARSGADRWLAQCIVALLPPALGRSTPIIVGVTALVSLIAHLVITSRTVRATVLIPAIALPLAGLGHDPKLLILVTVMGTGFCQTLTASAKPVALFAKAERPTYASADLLRLSAVLLPMMLVLLVLFALAVWS